eukprot:357241-Chlamydomonas_euryale.AAC.25
MCRIRVIFHKADAVAAENAKTGNLRKSDHGGIDPPHGREVERYEASSAVKPSSSSTGKGRPPGSGLGCGQARAATTKAPRPPRPRCTHRSPRGIHHEGEQNECHHRRRCEHADGSGPPLRRPAQQPHQRLRAAVVTAANCRAAAPAAIFPALGEQPPVAHHRHHFAARAHAHQREELKQHVASARGVERERSRMAVPERPHALCRASTCVCCGARGGRRAARRRASCVRVEVQHHRIVEPAPDVCNHRVHGRHRGLTTNRHAPHAVTGHLRIATWHCACQQRS